MPNKKILIVDDDPDIVKLLSMRIEANGYVVYSAGSGEEGIKKAKEEKPDLIVLDVLMPKMDGYTCLKFLKADNLTKDIPVIILTVRSEKKIGDIFKVEGVKGFLEKPYEPDKLLGMIKKVIGD